MDFLRNEEGLKRNLIILSTYYNLKSLHRITNTTKPVKYIGDISNQMRKSIFMNT